MTVCYYREDYKKRTEVKTYLSYKPENDLKTNKVHANLTFSSLPVLINYLKLTASGAYVVAYKLLQFLCLKF